ncbi:hypothetical protein Tco_1253285 [Tanacetum coccineum]
MVALVIHISLDSSEESVGSHVSRVTLFDAIPAIIPVILVIPVEVPIVPVDPLVVPKVGAFSVTSPAGVLDLVDYSSSDSNPSEDSLPPVPELPLVSPFLCSDDSEVDSESEPAEQKPEMHESLAVHDAMVSRWRDRVASRPSLWSGSSPHDTLAPSSKFLVARLLTARKRVGPFHARRLAWRRVSRRSSYRHSSPDFTLDSSSSSSSLDSSSDTSSDSPSDSLSDTSLVHSLGCDASGQTHSGKSTRVASYRLVYPLVMIHDIVRHLDVGAPTLIDLLPPHKRFRDSYSPEDSKEEHMEIGTADAEAVANLGISDGVGVDTEDGIGIGVEIAASDIREDEEEFEAKANAGGTMEIAVDPLVTGGIFESTRGDASDLKGTLHDIVHYMSEVPLDRITEFETAQRQLETGQLMASGESWIG